MIIRDFLYSFTPMRFLPELPINALKEITPEAKELQNFFKKTGARLSEEVDKYKTPWLKRYNEVGIRIDHVEYPSCYYKLLKEGYEKGILWKFLEEKTLKHFFVQGYITSYYDPGLFCPYTVSMATLLSIYKYGDEALKKKFLPLMGQKEGIPWQGATWMTEIKGGSDLGNNTETLAFSTGNGSWYLKGEKYFSSNANAQLAVVAARPHNLKPHVKNLALFLVPRYDNRGELNYYIERLKNKIGTRSVPTGEIRLEKSEAYLLGSIEQGIYIIMEVLNLSRVANSIGSAAIIQHAINLAYNFASQRTAFGKKVIEFPLMEKQFKEKTKIWEKSYALAWLSAELFEKVWQQKPPYSEEYHAFRLLTHMTKYYTAEQAIRTTRWAMEVWGGIGTLEEFPVERLLREALVLAIWEGTQHRHALDALEVIKRKKAHLKLAELIPQEHRKEFVRKIEEFSCEEPSYMYENAVKFLYEITDFFGEKLLLTK